MSHKTVPAVLSVGALDATVSGVDMGVAATHVAPLECPLLMPIRQTADPERRKEVCAFTRIRAAAQQFPSICSERPACM